MPMCLVGSLGKGMRFGQVTQNRFRIERRKLTCSSASEFECVGRDGQNHQILLILESKSPYFGDFQI